MSKLIIVESPAKAKTIKKYLGSGYQVVASMGHVRDLPKSKLGVDVEKDFLPDYVEMPDKKDIITKLRHEAKDSSYVYLATDPDREGEAISWHLAHMLGLSLKEPLRVTFNEITKSGVQNGMAAPRKIDAALVDAQQTRRILDRLVGYKLSPFLWKKVKKGLSAGRVQSVVVRLIVDREREIRAFVPVEYWSIEALLSKIGTEGASFKAKFYGDQSGKLELHNQQETDEVLKHLENSPYLVSSIKKSVRQKNPQPPFITSTLQQDASRRLGFQSKRTMRAAQNLYEGVELPELGAVGLITYMRTDSLRIADEAALEAEEFIKARYGKEYLPPSRRVFKSKASAQDGHEAIRPTMPSLTPAQIKDSLSYDQYQLYKLVWERFMASQMANCVLDTVAADIAAGPYIFKASGYTVRFAGYTVLYADTSDENDDENTSLPPLEEGETLSLDKLEHAQKFTQPPSRYTEASLIKALEENGIGRPSTYAPIISTIVAREYVDREGKSFKPTPLGEATNELMERHFTSVVDVDFTATMEEMLDEIGEGKQQMLPVLREFYGKFAGTLQKAETEMDGTRIKVPDIESDVICDLCGKTMVVKSGRFGKFLACPGFPECRNTKAIVSETKGLCPRCGSKMLLKKSKNGHNYYGCANYPACDFMSWDEPIADLCPDCGATLFKKKGRDAKIYCAKTDCGYETVPTRRKKGEAGIESEIETDDRPEADAKAAGGTKTAKTATKAKTAKKATSTKAKTTAKSKPKTAKPAAKKTAKTAKTKAPAKKGSVNE